MSLAFCLFLYRLATDDLLFSPSLSLSVLTILHSSSVVSMLRYFACVHAVSVFHSIMCVCADVFG